MDSPRDTSDSAPPAKRARRSLAEKETAIRQAVATSFARDAFQANLLCEHETRAATQLLPVGGDELAPVDVARFRHALAYLRYQKEIHFAQRARRSAAFASLADGATRIAAITSTSERTAIQIMYDLLARAPEDASLLVAWLLLHGVWTRAVWLALLGGKTTRTALMPVLVDAVRANTNMQFQAHVDAIAGAENPFDACVALTCASHVPAPV